MAIETVPSYSLGVLYLPNIDDPQDIAIQIETLVPPDANVPPVIISFLKYITRDYVYELGNEFKKNAHARLTFSKERGITFDSYSDVKIKQVFEKNINNLWSQIIQSTPQKLSDDEANKQVLLRAQLRAGGMDRPIKIDLNINYHIPKTQGAGLTTSFLRFPHLLKDLSTRFKHGKQSDQTKICVVGPGLFEEEGSLPSCPQLVEIYSIFPKAQFLLLDNDKRVLKVMKEQFHHFQFMSYDPCTLISRSTKHESNPFYALEAYQGLFQEMKETLSEKAIAPKDAKKMLQNIWDNQPLMLRAETDKIQLRDFDIISSSVKDDEKKTFDVIIATLSITLAATNQIGINPAFNCFSLLGKFLAALKENGSLYIDSVFIKEVLEKLYGKEGFALGIQYLEIVLGNRLSIEEIPLSDFLPEVQGNSGIVMSFSKKGVVDEKGIPTITTHSINVVTRTSEKISLTREEQTAIQLKLVNMLKAFIPKKS